MWRQKHYQCRITCCLSNNLIPRLFIPHTRCHTQRPQISRIASRVCHHPPASHNSGSSSRIPHVNMVLALLGHEGCIEILPDGTRPDDVFSCGPALKQSLPGSMPASIYWCAASWGSDLQTVSPCRPLIMASWGSRVHISLCMKIALGHLNVWSLIIDQYSASDIADIIPLIEDLFKDDLRMPIKCRQMIWRPSCLISTSKAMLASNVFL